jgi:hypothetical protein
MAAELEVGECRVHCKDCNAYMWSVASCDYGDRDLILISCPCKKDPCGECTGIPKPKH